MPVLTLMVCGANVGCVSSERETSILVSLVTRETVALRASKLPVEVAAAIVAGSIEDDGW